MKADPSDRMTDCLGRGAYGGDLAAAGLLSCGVAELDGGDGGGLLCRGLDSAAELDGGDGAGLFVAVSSEGKAKLLLASPN